MPRKKPRVSGVFLSHSSRDKEFVTRLACDLVNAGFPVWFDTWELETGDSLFHKIYEGIDQASALVLVLSRNSVKSKWVQKELRGALSKEEELKHNFLVPIKLEKCAIPLSIRDRVYADFTSDYLLPLERLEALLRTRSADKIVVPFEKRLVPLRISQGVYLDQTSFQARIVSLRQHLEQGNQVKSNQFVLYPEDDYRKSRALLTSRLDELAKSSEHSPQLEQALRSIFESIRKIERSLLDGLAAIINGLATLNELAFVGVAGHWYTRIIRSILLSRMWRAQADLPNASDFGRQAMGDPVNYDTAAKFFEVDEVICCDIWKPASGESFSFFVDAKSEVGRWFEENPQLPDVLQAFWSPTLMYQYAIPQMVYKSYPNPTPAPFGWDFRGCQIGRH